MAAPLGCGNHQARIFDRITGALVTDADTLLEVEWNRVLDDYSDARIIVQPDGDCCERLGEISAWRHKLVIYRDGAEVWEGYVISAQWATSGAVEINAVDVLAWLDRRVPHEDILFDNRDLTDVAQWLIEDGFRPDDPGHTVEVVEPTRIYGDRQYFANDGQTGDHLRDLAETGLDYTAVGSKIILLSEEFCELVGSLTDADFPDGLAVVEDGYALATRWVVHGKDDVVGIAGGIDPYYGLLERSVEETSILDDDSAAAAARSRLSASLPVPVFIDSQETTLSPDADIDLETLVPGWCLDVATTTTCRRITQRLKIVGVSVIQDGDGERVSVQLTHGSNPATAGRGV